jgi:hypothetical protein
MALIGYPWAFGCEYGFAYVTGSVQSNFIAGFPSASSPDREAIKIGCDGFNKAARRRAVLPEDPVIRMVMLRVQ